ncbi:hypothetical protein [Ktedonobacter racemifer]|uniref:Uncharacterized protein n=1 Tax=Ktedonobacter racemifer DSM 44963 TaxID=485913 RepID=D6TX14_KTERA|nr:hypothetical protein [Ktedonobacter racemifer]EFH84747.1 hypothetical protein Krac_5850 [Ktedonobacter racemifer DSM 44963]
MSSYASRDKELVYGDSDAGFLVFMQRDLAELYAALAKSKTWGELKVSVAADIYQEAVERAFWITEEAYESQAMPLPEDAFDLYDVSDYVGTDWPPYPIQEMLEWMPADIQQQYGEVQDTMFDGPQLIIDTEHKLEIVSALEKQGYVCIEDDLLARIAIRNSSSSVYEQKWA